MKSIFDGRARAEITERINSLTESSKALWGEMAVGQMIRHCAVCEEYYHGNIKVKRSFLGRLFGRSALSGILKDETSGLGRNAPTAPQFIVRDDVQNLENEKEKWKSLIASYETYENETFTHWFFGKMSKTQLGQFIYKHCDHHLRQFGV